ncbi:hypothetical protein SUGI_0151990 [Cryptomeria japonica]|uniref:S-adenosylmethionine decarboxylase proenzyme 3 n=1 Tax=Cryptomeria japonica TaxID=3369 RepID=UPI002408E618|nr:S-adenosylmethionine decarboxylase proenzyme 3 [Cryptomeria japonica]GLJ11319.1 hypothetical protein SUGI_0151990 [Cryptomeria japonica]
MAGGGVGGTEAVPFEGFEKRLEMEFEFMAEAEAWKGKSLGLRGLSVADLRAILREAQCSIVAGLSNALFDSYVLSESSLFIYPLKVVIKTCGSTQLLKAIPPLLSHATQMWLSVRGCRYSRGSFLFSAAQPFPHGSFAEEVEFLDRHFPTLATKASYVMGNDNESTNMRWHVYSAVRKDEESLRPNYTVEVCMRDLDKGAAAHFFNKTSNEMTEASGIDTLLGNCEICDFAFNPCGYSMNTTERGGAGYSTIHVTPEEGYSYASFELMDYDLTTLNMQHLLNRVAAIFNPSTFSISLYTNRRIQSIHSLSPRPTNYQCQSSTRRQLPAGGLQVFHTFTKQNDTNCSAHKVPLPLFPKEIGTEAEAEEDAEEGSLKGINKNICYRIQCCGMDAASLQADAISSSAAAAVDIGRKY